MVYDIIKLEQREEESQLETGDIETLFLFDRGVDLVFGMSNTLVHTNADLVGI